MTSRDLSLRRRTFVGSSLLLACGLLLASTPLFATEIPSGLHESVIAGDLSGPTSIAWSPEGELWVATRFFKIWIQRPDETVLVATLNGAGGGERAIGTIAFDPDHAVNGHVWVYYTAAGPPRNLLSRFTREGDALLDEVVVLEGPPLSGIVHNGGCLAFSDDGSILVGTGDDASGSTYSQNPHDLRGKILRIRPDGSPAPHNAFPDGIGGDPRVWAWGLRNPFRCTQDPLSGTLWIGDVGLASWEEIDLSVRGANYG